MKQKLGLIASVMGISLLFVACGDTVLPTGKTETSTAMQETSSMIDKTEEANEFLQKNFPSNGETELLNFREPQVGDEIAIIKTSVGEIKLMLFSEIAPKAVEQFKTLATEGYYDGVSFDRITKEFLIQTGNPSTEENEPTTTATPLSDECDETALNLRGAMGLSQDKQGGNQFFIIQAGSAQVDDKLWDMLEKEKGMAFPLSVKEIYQKQGGVPWLDFHSTVFAQVFDGMDVVDTIAFSELDDALKPITPTLVESVVVKTATIEDLEEEIESEDDSDEQNSEAESSAKEENE